jgi:cell division protein FtsI (penicillin-binding protein 3)
MKELLEGVVESGTMKEYKSPLYNYAGKTGTAQLDYKRSETTSEIGGHQASFVGYFPAENPKYSCIVVVVDPKRGSFYGSTVAGSAFRKIADNCYASIAGLQTYITKNTPKKMELAALPSLSAGKGEELKTVLDKINYKYQTNKIEDYGAIVAQKDSIKLVSREITKNKVPNVIGMGLKDALFLLENKGMKVEIRGIGKVTEQSVPAGTIAKGQYVTLHLN